MLAVALNPLEHRSHFVGHVTIDVVQDQLGVAENGVEWRAQLVTHVGEELRFVLARNLELLALVLDLME